MDNSEKVFKAIKEAAKPVRPGDLVDVTGLDSKEISDSIKKLKEEGRIISPKRCYYSLPE